MFSNIFDDNFFNKNDNDPFKNWGNNVLESLLQLQNIPLTEYQQKRMKYEGDLERSLQKRESKIIRTHTYQANALKNKYLHELHDLEIHTNKELEILREEVNQKLIEWKADWKQKEQQKLQLQQNDPNIVPHLVGEETRENIKIINGEKQKVVKKIELYSDGTQKVFEQTEDNNGKIEKVYRLDSTGQVLQLENKQ